METVDRSAASVAAERLKEANRKRQVKRDDKRTAESERAELEATAKADAEEVARAAAAGVLLGKGVTGRVEVDADFVTIRRKGALAKANYGWTRGEKRIPIASITAVQFKKPGATNGYIQFTLAGGNENTGGVMSATKDENSVLFNTFHKAEFEAIRDHVERTIAERSRPAAISPTPAAPAAPDLATQLRDLAGLRDDGIITQSEFDEQKARLLNG